MSIPNLKRAKISSPDALRRWFAEHADLHGAVMLVTHTGRSSKNQIPRESVRDAAEANGWKTGARYTLGPDLLGHVTTRTAR